MTEKTIQLTQDDIDDLIKNQTYDIDSFANKFSVNNNQSLKSALKKLGDAGFKIRAVWNGLYCVKKSDGSVDLWSREDLIKNLSSGNY